MWTAVYMAEGYNKAKEIEEKLQEEGFLIKVKLFTKDTSSDLNDLYEILAPEFEAQEVQSALMDLGY